MSDEVRFDGAEPGAPERSFDSPRPEPAPASDPGFARRATQDGGSRSATGTEERGSAEQRPGYGAGYGYGAYGAEEQTHLMEYVRVLYKRRWTAVTVFLLVTVWVALYTFTATPLYSGQARLLIENENPNVVKFEEVMAQSMSSLDYYQTQYRILESRQIAKRALDTEKLWTHPAFAGSISAGPGFSLNPMTWPAITYAFIKGFFEGPPKPPSAAELAATQQARAIDAVIGNLRIIPVEESRLVDVAYSSSDPQLAARMANAIARAYIEQNLESKFVAARDATEFLNDRMKEQRKSLEESEEALQKYREETGAVSLEDRQNIVVQRLADLNAAVTKARTERIAKQAVYNQIRDLQNDPAGLDTIPAILSSSFIQQLKGQLSELQRQQAQQAEKLGERHPEMVKTRSAIETTQLRLSTEVQKVVQALRNDYEAAVANEKSLMASLDQQTNEAQELNRTAIRYGVLQRDSTSDRVMFEGLLQRSKETGISGELKTSNIRVVDAAEVPRRPSSPNKFNNMLFGLLGGTVLGLGLAFFFEYVDRRIKSPDEIRNDLGLAFLGLVPAVDAKSLTAPLVTNGAPAPFVEAFRSIRTSVLFSSAEAGHKSIAVTSTTPGEGKTVVSANLAVSLALAGQRVLLIDADMRRAKVHELFELPQEPGLSNVLVGSERASEAIKRTSIPDLWVLTAGKHPPNPAELLGSRRFKDFVASLAEHFTWVIIDTPPVMAVTDASVLSHSVSGVVFVIGAEMTNRAAAKAALDQLDTAKVKYVGGILNKVRIERNAYYYSRYYHKRYAEYYRSATSQ